MADGNGMRLAIVTGGLGVLGRSVGAELVACNWQVVAVDVRADKLTRDSRTIYKAIDLSDRHAVADLYAGIAQDLGKFDALINVAGGFVWELVEHGSVTSWDQMYAINLRTAVNSVQAALSHFREQGAAIVNVGAEAANNPKAGMAPYAASKAGIKAFTESLADELRPRGIRVNAVLPTILDTPTNRSDIPDADVSAWVSPSAAAKVIEFLVSDASAAVTGAAIPLSFAPPSISPLGSGQ